MSGAETGFGHLDFGPSILFRVSNFVLRIYRVKGERLQHPYGVLPQSRGLPPGRRPYGPEAGPGFFTRGSVRSVRFL